MNDGDHLPFTVGVRTDTGGSKPAKKWSVLWAENMSAPYHLLSSVVVSTFGNNLVDGFLRQGKCSHSFDLTCRNMLNTRSRNSLKRMQTSFKILGAHELFVLNTCSNDP